METIWSADRIWLSNFHNKAYPLDTVRKLNVYETFRIRPKHLLNVLCKFNLRPVSMEYISLGKHSITEILLVNINPNFYLRFAYSPESSNQTKFSWLDVVKWHLSNNYYLRQVVGWKRFLIIDLLCFNYKYILHYFIVKTKFAKNFAENSSFSRQST